MLATGRTRPYVWRCVELDPFFPARPATIGFRARSLVANCAMDNASVEALKLDVDASSGGVVVSIGVKAYVCMVW